MSNDTELQSRGVRMAEEVYTVLFACSSVLLKVYQVCRLNLYVSSLLTENSIPLGLNCIAWISWGGDTEASGRCN